MKLPLPERTLAYELGLSPRSALLSSDIVQLASLCLNELGLSVPAPSIQGCALAFVLHECSY